MKQDWKIQKLKEVVEFQGGSQPPKSTFIYEPKDSYVRLLQIRDFKSDDKAVYIPISAKNRICDSSDVLIGRYGASVGRICSGKSGAYNVALMKASPDSQKIVNKYFFYYLTSPLFQKPLINVSSRSAQNGFNKDNIGSFELLIPPLDEQKRIVAKLDKCFESIDKAKANVEKNLQNTKDLFESQLNEIFSQKGDGWEEKTIIDLCSHKSQIVGGPFGSNMKVSDYKEDGVPILRLQNIGKGYFIDKAIKFISDKKAEELAYHSFKADDIVLAKLGIPIGKTCIVPQKYRHGIVVADVVRIRPNKEEINYIFLKHFLNSDNAVNQLSSDIRGATRPRVNIGEVRGLRLSVPILKEQLRIVSRIDRLEKLRDKQVSCYQQELDALDELKKSILEKAFNGEL